MKKYEVWENGQWTTRKNFIRKHECSIEGCKNLSREMYIRYGTLLTGWVELCPSCYLVYRSLSADKKYFKDYKNALKKLGVGV